MVGKFIVPALAGLFFVPSAFASLWSDDLTSPNAHGYCTESSHVGQNSCDRAFNDTLTNGNYWQLASGTWFVGFHFYGNHVVSRYSIVNVNNDPSFKLQAYQFQAKTATGWVTLVDDPDYDFVVGIRNYVEVPDPVSSDEYRFVVTQGGNNWTLLTQIELFESDRDKNGPFEAFTGTGTFSNILYVGNDGSLNVNTDWKLWQDLSFYSFLLPLFFIVFCWWSIRSLFRLIFA